MSNLTKLNCVMQGLGSLIKHIYMDGDELELTDSEVRKINNYIDGIALILNCNKANSIIKEMQTE